MLNKHAILVIVISLLTAVDFMAVSYNKRQDNVTFIYIAVYYVFIRNNCYGQNKAVYSQRFNMCRGDIGGHYTPGPQYVIIVQAGVIIRLMQALSE